VKGKGRKEEMEGERSEGSMEGRGEREGPVKKGEA